MLNDIQLTQDGLSPSWRLTDGRGTSLAGYDWSTAGIYGEGGGSLKYNIIYTPPAGLTQWGIEGRDNIGGAIATGTVNLPDNSVLLQQIVGTSSAPASTGVYSSTGQFAVDGAGDGAGDGSLTGGTGSTVAPPATLNSIMAFLITIKAELDAVKAKTDLPNTAVSVVIGDALPSLNVVIS